MSTEQIDALFKLGRDALKSGDKPKAKQHFLDIIALDDRHEMAWLWLGAAVQTREDRLICLENVLAINPNNERANQGLAKLKENTAVKKQQTVRHEHAPLTGAAAILYPERHVKEWEWVDPTNVEQGTTVGFGARTAVDDVWSQDVDICPYCATVIAEEEKRCVGCKRPLIIKKYRYPKMSSTAHLFWVMLLSLSNINLIQLLFDFIYWQDIVGVLIDGLLVVLFFTVAVGTYFRQFWAFITAQILLFAVLLIALLENLFSIERVVTHLPDFDPAIQRLVQGLGGGFDQFLFIFETAAALIGLILAVVFLAPDFEKFPLRLVAKARDGLAHGADYHLEAKRAAARGMWATAVKNWQRAAAKEPNHILFLEGLAKGYLQLRFFQRSIDVLQSAQQITTQREKKQALQAQIETVSALYEQHIMMEQQKKSNGE